MRRSLFALTVQVRHQGGLQKLAHPCSLTQTKLAYGSTVYNYSYMAVINKEHILIQDILT